MKAISKIGIAVAVLLSSIGGFAQTSDEKTETVKIYGKCEICKSTIEKAGNVKKVANVVWDEGTQTATLSYNPKKTSQNEILKRIALAGYDNEKFLAPDDVYAKLADCCRYERALKPVAKSHHKDTDVKNGHENHNAGVMTQSKATEVQNASQLKSVFDSYFSVKDALIKSDAAITSSKATELLKAINAVEMTKPPAAEHTVWMSVLKDLTANAEKVAGAKEVSKQREIFATLSQNIYALVKVSKQDTPVYYQHCPMFNNGKGAHWLSRENGIKNPYYGAQMLTCGSVQETLN